jgi:hypothetical protein
VADEPHKAATDDCEPNTLSATIGLTVWAGAAMVVDAEAATGATHKAIATL